MENNKLNKWKDNFLKDLCTKESIIVAGNVLDICQDVHDHNKYNLIVDNILHMVEAEGYKNIYLWDGTSAKTIRGRALEIPEVPANGATNNGSAGSPMANEFADMMGGPTGAPIGGETIDGFFTSMLETLSAPNTDSSVFFVNYSDQIFGNANSLSEQERSYLVRINKALQAQKYDTNTGNFIHKKGNKVVFLVKNGATIPPSYYQNNPMVSTLTIPDPGRNERAAFVDEILPAIQLNKDLNADSAKLDRENFIDALEGFKLKEIFQLTKLSNQNKETLSWEKLVNQFKFGEKASPWEELDREKLMTLADILKNRVKGQDEAIDKVRSVIIRAFTGLSGLQHSAKQNKPKGTLFFVGPTGVGKTELAKSIAEFLFGDESACIRFDMSEYSQKEDDQKLIGAPPGYVGYEEGGKLTNMVREKPFCVLLFDEIEKAHDHVLDKFLQILEDGRLTDGKGQTVSFSETFIIFTSNIGAANSDISPNDSKADASEKFLTAVRKYFVEKLGRPEILNRIGKKNVVPFNFINDPAIFSKIAKSKMTPLVNALHEKYRVTLKFQNEEEVFDIISRKADAKNGGRDVLNVIDEEINTPVADFVFDHMDELQGRTIVVKLANKNLGHFSVEFA